MQIDPSNPGISADYILSELEFFRKKYQHERVIGMALTPSHLDLFSKKWYKDNGDFSVTDLVRQIGVLL